MISIAPYHAHITSTAQQIGPVSRPRHLYDSDRMALRY